MDYAAKIRGLKDWIPKRCEWHSPYRYSSDVDAAEDADKRMARGEEQVWCSECHRYLWPDQFGDNPNNYDNAQTDPHHGGKIWNPKTDN